MDIRWKKYSHLIKTKIIVFLVVVLGLTGVITSFTKVAELNDGDFEIVFEDDYLHSSAFMEESEKVLSDLTKLIGTYKNENYILSGGTISEDEFIREQEREQEILYSNFKHKSKSYDPTASQEENFKKFQEEYAAEISQVRERMIRKELREYNFLLQRLEEHKEILYYTSDGVNVYANSTKAKQEEFKDYPSYMILEGYERDMYPKEIKEMHWVTRGTDQLDPENHVIYVAFTEQFFNQRINEWKDNKVIVTNNLYILVVSLIGFVVALVYLVLVIGRKSFDDKELHMNSVNRLYNDINLGLWIVLIGLWLAFLEITGFPDNDRLLVPITIPMVMVWLVLFLSLVKHVKNRTLLKHTLVYSVIYKVIKFFGDIYDSGSVGIKLVFLVVGYPILVALTFFMFPVTLVIAAWFTLKRVKAFNAIKEGVKKIKSGDLNHTIDPGVNGEFGNLAANINSIADGLRKAVKNELKSERLKTELITNVSHDIRTPLTSIITYVDLLKKEKNPDKVEEYIEVLDQKSQRLKTLTDDLFEATKASSGNVPVNLEEINFVSLLTQGLGELNDKIQDSALEFKVNYPKEKIWIKADGKLLWRSLENLLSNIFKYALKGSRVYLDIEDLGKEVLLTLKNISAYELNISADELMERFKRGDESRSTQGSGLGLSIAKSLIEVQGGKFHLQVDGDLFKVMIYMPKK